jgi:hypothetical protein
MEGCEKKWTWPILKYLGTCPVVTRKNQENLISKNSQSPGWNLQNRSKSANHYIGGVNIGGEVWEIFPLLPHIPDNLYVIFFSTGVTLKAQLLYK